MKKWIFSVGMLFISAGLFAQVKNTENSNYQFTKVAHLDANPVQSQGNTGTCWSFSALSFFESEMIRKGNKTPDRLSEMYIARKAYEGKADKYIRMDGKSNFSEGGAFHDIPYVFKHYGIVPEQVYKGYQGDKQYYNHNEMFNILEGVVEGVLKYSNNLRPGTSLSPQWKSAVTGVLDAYLGKDVKEFEFKGKKYTPKTYMASLNLNMDDYVSITSFTNHELNKPCQLEIQDNWGAGMSYNVAFDDLYKIAEYALKNGYTIAWASDVSEKGFSFQNGIAIFPEDLSTINVSGKDNKNFSDGGAERSSNAFLNPGKEIKVTAELRQEGYDNKTTTDDHGMHITGLYKDQNGVNYFLVKNSWGTSNYPQGYLYVSESYFNYKTINIYLHKDGIPKDVRKKLNL